MPQTFTYDEFRLDIADKWKEYPSPQRDVLMLQSPEDNASVVITTQLVDIAIDKAEGIADANIRSRIEAHKQHYPNLQLIDATITTHSSGAALEMLYAVAEAEKAVLMYIGYVTPKKILSALLSPQPTGPLRLICSSKRCLVFNPEFPSCDFRLGAEADLS